MRKKNKVPYSNVHFTISTEFKENLQDYADRNGIERSSLIRLWLMERFKDEQEKERKIERFKNKQEKERRKEQDK